MNKLPVFFISHGGGPWPWVENMRPHFVQTEKALAELGKKYSPRAIVSITGHWEENDFTVSSGELPGMVYDYHGFPEETYHIKYPAPGSPAIALQIKSLLGMGGFKVNDDPLRGFDHGTFVPLYLMYPHAQIPVVQLSIRNSLDPKVHLEAGALLKTLRDENILIIGSGLSYHNLRKFFHGGKEASFVFEQWLTSAVSAEPAYRNQQLIDWEKAPMARDAHPREDHLIPLMMVAGAADLDRGKVLFIDHGFDVTMASYQFG